MGIWRGLSPDYFWRRIRGAFGVAGRGDETAAGGPRSMARYSWASDPAVPGVPADLMKRRWAEETD